YEFKSIITSTSYKYSLPKDLIQAVIHVESAYNPKAVSPKGAKGLMQLMPSNLKIYGVRNPYSPTENINAGSKLLSKLVKKYNNINLALAAYNAGEGAVKKYNGVPPYKETKNYIKLVLYYQKKYKALA
ncbi:UNVERIFIED_CONTAM: hypothetical protein GTU68_060912, partial [Idotea baltica]|nr:hypothetical protein [Idotea baltica]